MHMFIYICISIIYTLLYIIYNIQQAYYTYIYTSNEINISRTAPNIRAARFPQFRFPQKRPVFFSRPSISPISAWRNGLKEHGFLLCIRYPVNLQFNKIQPQFSGFSPRGKILYVCSHWVSSISVDPSRILQAIIYNHQNLIRNSTC